MFFNLEKSTAALNWALASAFAVFATVTGISALWGGYKSIQQELEIRRVKRALAAKNKK